MQKAVLLIAAYFLTIIAFAQQKNYVYIEADNGQPFYVKLNDKIHSSSQSGYILLSELTENNYDLRIGFPKNTYPEQRFSIVLNKKDQGFQLKNFGEKGWGLFNLQTLAVVMNNNIQPTANDQVKKTDGFSVMLSKVVNDSSLLVNTPKPVPVKEVVAEVAKEEVKSATDTAKEEVKPAVAEVTKEEIKPATDTAKEEVKPVVAEVAKEEIKPATDTAKEEVKKEATVETATTITVQKLFDRRFEKVYEASYVDKTNGANDTINISYPINAEITKKDDNTQAKVDPNNMKTDAAPITKTINSDCKLFAQDLDVDKLRVKMLNEKTVDERLVTARKYFKTKCFTVKQIRALTELFPEDEDRYRLFDTAYPFISDTENFPLLEESLKEDYYKNRFKAMIRK